MVTPITFSPTGPAGFLEGEDVALATDTLIAGDPRGADHTYFERPSANLKAGIWRSAPYTEWYDQYPCDEFMYVLDGHVFIHNDECDECFDAGSAFVLPRGFCGYWRQPVPLLKYYVLVE